VLNAVTLPYSTAPVVALGETPDEGAAFPDGGLRQQGPKAGMDFFVRGRQLPHHQIKGYFAIPCAGGGSNFR